jgi:hypothetical protein
MKYFILLFTLIALNCYAEKCQQIKDKLYCDNGVKYIIIKDHIYGSDGSKVIKVNEKFYIQSTPQPTKVKL